VSVFVIRHEHVPGHLQPVIYSGMHWSNWDASNVAFLGTRVVILVTGKLADKPTCGQSSRGLVNPRTSQLADSKFL